MKRPDLTQFIDTILRLYWYFPLPSLSLFSLFGFWDNISLICFTVSFMTPCKLTSEQMELQWFGLMGSRKILHCQLLMRFNVNCVFPFGGFILEKSDTCRCLEARGWCLWHWETPDLEIHFEQKCSPEPRRIKQNKMFRNMGAKQ